MLDEELLFFIAKSAMLRGTFVSSTAKISVKLGISQQSVSRKLRELQDKGLAEVSASPRGVEAKLTEKGTRLLKSRYLELKQLFEAKHLKSISGSLKTGLGEGAYYVAQAPYVKQFKELLGFKPYFNLVLWMRTSLWKNDCSLFLALNQNLERRYFSKSSLLCFEALYFN